MTALQRYQASNHPHRTIVTLQHHTLHIITVIVKSAKSNERDMAGQYTMQRTRMAMRRTDDRR